MIDLPRLYTDERFRDETLRYVSDPITRRFWQHEFAGYDQRFRTEAVAPILNKAGQFATSPNVRAIIGQSSPKFDLSFAMDNRRILIANLGKGVIGEQAANLLGSLIVSHLQLVAMSRSIIAEEDRVPFFVHVDEFQSFGTDAFASLMSEARKYGAFSASAINLLTRSRRASARQSSAMPGRLSCSASAVRMRHCLCPSSIPWSRTRSPHSFHSRHGYAAPLLAIVIRSIAHRVWLCHLADWRALSRRAAVTSVGPAKS